MTQVADMATPETALEEPLKATPDKSPLKRPARLMNRNFVLLWQGQAVSRLGRQVSSIAMIFWVKEATGSASLIGLMMMISSIPGVVFSGIGGAFADHHSRRKIIIYSDVVRGILVLSLAGLLFMAPQATELTIVWLMAVAVCVSVTGSFFGPAISASIPDLVPRDRVARANSLRQLTTQVTLFLGQGLGGTLFRLLGAPVLVFANGISFLFSAVSETFIDIPQNIPKTGTTWKEQAAVLKKDIVEGLRYVWQAPGLRRLFFFSAIFNFFTMPILVLFPFYVVDFLNLKEDWYGFLLATFGAGVLVGSLGAGFTKQSGKARARLMILFAIFSSVAAGLLGFAHHPLVVMMLAFLVGAMGGFNGINVTTILQITTPSEIRGRVFGLLGTLSGSLAPLGMGLGGIVFDLTGKSIPLIYVSCGGLMVLLSLVVSMSKEFRRFLAYEPVDEVVKRIHEQAIAYSKGKKYAEAIRLWQKALEVDPNDTEVLYRLGVVHFMDYKYEQCIEFLSRLLELSPDHYKAMLVIGTAYSKLDELEKAEQFFQKSLELNPGDKWAYLYLGFIYSRQQEFDKGIKVFHEVIDLFPNEIGAYLGLGRLYSSIGEVEEAERYFKKVLEIDADGQIANYAKEALNSTADRKE